MRKLVFLIPALLVHFFSFSQDETEKITDGIVKEGKKLYRSEMASWYGTDIFLERFKDKASSAQGYVSYVENDKTKCIFYSKGDKPKVVVTIIFDSTYNTSTAEADGTSREFTPMESSLYKIREAALKDINTDTMYKFYKNTDLNLIPFIDGKDKKVYVLTGPKENGVIIIGNDYLLTFDENDKLLAKKSLHKNLHFFYFGNKANEESVGGIHTHLPETGDFITATDICTLMLYEKFAKWESHVVVSEKYVCIWNCKTDVLLTLTREAWDKINEDQKKRNKN
jgi:hypothetical protein